MQSKQKKLFDGESNKPSGSRGPAINLRLENAIKQEPAGLAKGVECLHLRAYLAKHPLKFVDNMYSIGSGQLSAAGRKFPTDKYETATQYLDAYRNELVRAWSTVDAKAVTAAVDILRACIERDGIIYACGNGGSAAIANHLLCDFQKGIQTDTTARPRVVSLSSHLELITAISNDISYDDIFVYQLRTMARPGDVLLTISSSGNSENVVRAVKWAKDNGIPTIALVGFSGGRSAALADVTVHVTAENYGTVEDVHQSVMHIFSQYLRQSHMAAELIAHRKF